MTNTHTITTPTTTRNDAGTHEGTERGTDRGGSRVLPLIGAASLALSPLLLAGGAVTSPPQESDSSADYIASLAADPFLTSLSANFFHYAWVATAVGLVAALTLVRGRRGRALTTVGGIVGVFGSIQMSGLLFNDWFLSALGRELSIDRAVEVWDTMGDPSVTFWLLSSQVGGLLGPVIVFAGLARAGVLSGWLAPLALLPMAAFFLLPGVLGVVVGLVCGAPFYVTAWRILQRSRLA